MPELEGAQLPIQEYSPPQRETVRELLACFPQLQDLEPESFARLWELKNPYVTDIISEALDPLPQNQQAVMGLRLNLLSHEQIAMQLETNPAVIIELENRAREALRLKPASPQLPYFEEEPFPISEENTELDLKDPIIDPEKLDHEQRVQLAMLNSQVAGQKTINVEDYQPLVRGIIVKFGFTPSTIVDYDDMMQEGYIGLLSALAKFDPERGVLFSTYAFNRIKGSILDALRKHNPLSRGLLAARRNVEIFDTSFVQTNGRKPTTAEISAGTELTPKTIQTSQMSPTALSFEELAENRFKQDQSKLLALADGDPFTTPEEALTMTEESREVDRALAVLPPREKSIINGYYFEGKSLVVIGEELGISESRTSQVRRIAVTIIKDYLNRTYIPKPRK